MHTLRNISLQMCTQGAALIWGSTNTFVNIKKVATALGFILKLFTKIILQNTNYTTYKKKVFETFFLQI